MSTLLSRLYSLESDRFLKTTAPLSTLLGVFKLSSKSMAMKLNIFSGPLQSPDLNIIEYLWEYLESRFPPPSNLSKLVTFLKVKWLNITLNTVHELYVSIPCVIKSRFQSKGGPTPY